VKELISTAQPPSLFSYFNKRRSLAVPHRARQTLARRFLEEEKGSYSVRRSNCKPAICRFLRILMAGNVVQNGNTDSTALLSVKLSQKYCFRGCQIPFVSVPGASNLSSLFILIANWLQIAFECGYWNGVDLQVNVYWVAILNCFSALHITKLSCCRHGAGCLTQYRIRCCVNAKQPLNMLQLSIYQANTAPISRDVRNIYFLFRFCSVRIFKKLGFCSEWIWFSSVQ